MSYRFGFFLAFSLPSLVYLAQKEDKVLENKFVEEWEKDAAEVGFLIPEL